MVTCKNCGNEFKGKFCNECGQESSTDRLNLHYVLHEFKNNLIHIDKVGLYSIVQLFTRPGHSIREYIEGKRIKHYKPLALVIFLSTIYGVLYHTYHIDLISESNIKIRSNSSISLFEINEWLSSHYSWVIIAGIPFYSIGSYLLFRKLRYNFIEHLVLNTFIASQRLITQILLLPILLYYYRHHQTHLYSYVLSIISLVFMTWTYVQFFNSQSMANSILKSILSYLFFWACILIIASITILIVSPH
jgi:hypothetical protein